MLLKLLGALLLSALTLSAEVNWASSYEHAQITAQKENKLLMVMLSKENCDACWYMENIVFDNQDILKMIEKKFIALHVDVNKNKIPANMPYIGTPTFYFINSEGKEVGKLEGAVTIKEFDTFVQSLK